MSALQRLVHFKTVHNALVRYGSHQNCPFKSQLFTVAYVIHHLPMGSFVAISALTEVVRLVWTVKRLIRYRRFTFKSRAEQSCLIVNIVPELIFQCEQKSCEIHDLQRLVSLSVNPRGHSITKHTGGGGLARRSESKTPKYLSKIFPKYS